MSASGRYSAQPSTSNTESESSQVHRSLSRPRPRPVLSCLRCRSRKIKCDRLLPCRQCTLTGHDIYCSYNLRPKADSSSSHSHNGRASVQLSTKASADDAAEPNPASALSTLSQTSLEKAEDLLSLQQRIQNLERLCGSHSRGAIDSSIAKTASDAEWSSGHLPRIDATLSVKISGSRYHSESYKKSLLHHFGVACRFIHGGFDDPIRAPVMNELRMFHDRFTKSRKRAAKVKPGYNQDFSLSGLLPDQSVCDEAVSSYFRFFENILRILHYPSFMDEYRRFWASTEEQGKDFRAFVPQLVVILAIFFALEDSSTAEPSRENRAMFLRSHVEIWLDSLTGRKQLTMATLRTRALLIVAQQVGAAPADEVWKSTGSLMRSAMAAGFHRDPSEFTHISIFEGEMRRKLWASIVELDLGASLNYGMPLMLHSGSFTCNSPSNLDDIDLFDEMTELPLSKSSSKSVDSTFQLTLAESLPLRIAATKQSGVLEDTQTRIRSFERHIQHLPEELRLTDNATKDLEHLFGTIMLNVHIRRILSHLYRSSAPSADLAAGKTTVDLQCSLSVLSYQSMLDHKTSTHKNGEWKMCWNLFHVLCKNDIMQAALDVCLHAQVPGLVSWTQASLLLAIDETITCFIKRIGRNGCDIKDITRLSVISQLLKAQITQGNREEMMEEGTRHVLFACRKAVSEQIGIENDEAINFPQVPSTEQAEGHGAASANWHLYAPDPSLTESDLASYLDMSEVNFEISLDQPPTNMYGQLWNQY